VHLKTNLDYEFYKLFRFTRSYLFRAIYFGYLHNYLFLEQASFLHYFFDIVHIYHYLSLSVKYWAMEFDMFCFQILNLITEKNQVLFCFVQKLPW